MNLYVIYCESYHIVCHYDLRFYCTAGVWTESCILLASLPTSFSWGDGAIRKSWIDLAMADEDINSFLESTVHQKPPCTSDPGVELDAQCWKESCSQLPFASTLDALLQISEISWASTRWNLGPFWVSNRIFQIDPVFVSLEWPYSGQRFKH